MVLDINVSVYKASDIPPVDNVLYRTATLTRGLIAYTE